MRLHLAAEGRSKRTPGQRDTMKRATTVSVIALQDDLSDLTNALPWWHAVVLDELRDGVVV